MCFLCCVSFFFFFSSRRRHTRCSRDWSSDVCSSDLAPDDLILPFLATVTFKAGPVAVGVLLAAASAGLLAGLPLVGPVGRRLRVNGGIVARVAAIATRNLLNAVGAWLMCSFSLPGVCGCA